MIAIEIQLIDVADNFKLVSDFLKVKVMNFELYACYALVGRIQSVK